RRKETPGNSGADGTAWRDARAGADRTGTADAAAADSVVAEGRPVDPDKDSRTARPRGIGRAVSHAAPVCPQALRIWQARRHGAPDRRDTGRVCGSGLRPTGIAA